MKWVFDMSHLLLFSIIVGCGASLVRNKNEETMTFVPWVRVGATGPLFEYPWHAGLSSDGRLCFMAEYEDWAYLVWDIDAQKVVWSVSRELNNASYPKLIDWIVDGHIQIKAAPAKGTYRVFGIHENYALESSHGIALRLETEVAELVLVNEGTQQQEQMLSYDPMTDWVVASFSDDGSTIAVMATHNITFFRQQPS
jgi:hypothetical protein